MSAPPAKPERKKAKYDFRQLPKEAWPHVRVYDRYGVEQKDVIEFDPETFEGVRALRDGSLQKVYLFNGYVSAAGVDHPDEEQLPEIIQDVRTEVITKGRASFSGSTRSLGPNPSLSDFSPERTDRMLKTSIAERAPDHLRCPKCQSGIRFDEEDIVCSNGNCGMKWHTNGGVGKG
jgi:hypothetical protein